MSLASLSRSVAAPGAFASGALLGKSGLRPAWAGRLSLLGQFRWASLVILVAGMLGVGAWVSQQAEKNALDRTAALTALYVNSALADPLASLATDSRLSPAQIDALNHMLRDTALGERLVDFRVWSPTGEVLYSPNQTLIGRQFPVSGNLARAVRGWVVADLSRLDQQENANLQGEGNSLLEVYTPVRQQDSDGRVLGVVEFYQRPDMVLDQINAERLRAWAIVGAATLVVYLLLSGIVQRASRVIAGQQAALHEHVEALELMHGRLRQAAGRTTSLNEQLLRRIGADLHAGPGQALALALLRMDPVHGRCTRGCVSPIELDTVRGAVDDALSDLRSIAAGLRLPGLESLTVTDVIQRAVAKHERRTGHAVALELDQVPEQAPLPTKIVLFRTLEEALSNATRHAQGLNVGVSVRLEGNMLAMQVADHGPGFDTARLDADTSLGLANCRERAELLGGRLEVSAEPASGSRVRLWLPRDCRTSD
jgi:signal transduction histidine kinase